MGSQPQHQTLWGSVYQVPRPFPPAAGSGTDPAIASTSTAMAPLGAMARAPDKAYGAAEGSIPFIPGGHPGRRHGLPPDRPRPAPRGPRGPPPPPPLRGRDVGGRRRLVRPARPVVRHRPVRRRGRREGPGRSEGDRGDPVPSLPNPAEVRRPASAGIGDRPGVLPAPGRGGGPPPGPPPRSGETTAGTPAPP